jgi:hypothetical protein
MVSRGDGAMRVALAGSLASKRPRLPRCVIAGVLAIAGIALGAAVLGRGGRAADPPARTEPSADRQTTLLGVSADGNAILYLEGQCNADRLMMALRRSATFEWVELTDQLASSQLAVLSSDGSESGVSNAEPVLAADEPRFTVGPIVQICFQHRTSSDSATGGK